MRFVLATNHFASVGGSETYLLTVAEQLLRLAHDVTIYCADVGQMSQIAQSKGIDVFHELDTLPDAVDTIISQDGIVAYQLADRFPMTPQIFVCHSPLFELQTPPAIPGIVSVVVVMSERFEKRVRALDTTHRIVRLRQPIDVERLIPRSSPNIRPQKALLLGNYLSGDARRILVDTWSAAGIEIEQVGAPAGTSSPHPEDAIARADIVVGKARAILDAMSCGRPAYVYDAWGTDGWVTPELYPLMEADAFSGLAIHRVIHAEQLRADLEYYNPAMGQANRELIMMYHNARLHTQQLVEISRELAPSAVPQTTPNRELSRLVSQLWRTEGELFKLRMDFAPTSDRVTEALAEVARLRVSLEHREAMLEAERLNAVRETSVMLEEAAKLRVSLENAEVETARLRAALEATESTLHTFVSNRLVKAALMLGAALHWARRKMHRLI